MIRLSIFCAALLCAAPADACAVRPELYSVVRDLQKFGRVTVRSGCRTVAHNRRVGGARHSLHLTGRAVDVRVFGNGGAAWRHLLTHWRGGLKRYRSGIIHIDLGSRRPM